MRRLRDDVDLLDVRLPAAFAGEFYDTDRQQILDIVAMRAMTYAENTD